MKRVRLTTFLVEVPVLMGASILVLPCFLAKAKLLADKVILGCWKLLARSNGNLLKDTGTECCHHGRTRGSEIIKTRNKMQSWDASPEDLPDIPSQNLFPGTAVKIKKEKHMICHYWAFCSAARKGKDYHLLVIVTLGLLLWRAIPLYNMQGIKRAKTDAKLSSFKKAQWSCTRAMKSSLLVFQIHVITPSIN